MKLALIFLALTSFTGIAHSTEPVPACEEVVLAWSCDTDIISNCWNQAQCPAGSNKGCWLRYEPSLGRNITECHCCHSAI